MKMPLPPAGVAVPAARCAARAARPDCPARPAVAARVAAAAVAVAFIGLPSAALAQGNASGLALSGQDLGAGAPVSRIYRSVARDGSVTFGDQPLAGSQAVEIRSFAASTDPAGIEAARQQRDYWRAQAQAFEERRRAREQEEREAQQARILAAERERLVQVPTRIYSRGPNFFAGPSVPMSMVSPTYSSSPGVPGGNGAGFIGSGFATAR